jgi:hypothetical protein
VTVDEVLTVAQQVGIRLVADGDQLRYRAPKGVLTSELRQALVRHRSTLLCVLQELQEERLGIMAADDLHPAPPQLNEPLAVGEMCPNCRDEGRIAHLYVRREGCLWCVQCLRRGGCD